MLRERFSRPLDRAAQSFSASTVEDRHLLLHDLWGSLAHARMLGTTGILPRRAARRIEAGLRSISLTAARGRFPLDPDLEDVHLNVEAALTRRIGVDGERLHTGRSRNDQVATDLALYLRDALLALEIATARLSEAFLAQARSPDGRGVIDGWTHLQPAQRVYWSQWLGSHALRLARDGERFAATRATLVECPLGSGALAGSSLPLDRQLTARLLGFERPSRSSVDAVSDRDVAVAALFDLALLAAHLSAIGEEFVVSAMPGVDRVALSDAFVTTSSLMPHKRNPDLAELARSEVGPSIGRVVAALAVLKGLPMGYQRDLQTLKPIVFEGVDRTVALVTMMEGMVASARFRTPGPAGSTGSVELVDALVRAGVPFRAAHGRVASYLAGGGADATTRAALGRAFPELRRSGFTWPTPSGEPDLRTTVGGSSRIQVARLIQDVGRRTRALRNSARRERERLATLRSQLGAIEPAFLSEAALRPGPALPARPGRARSGTRSRGPAR